MKSKFRSVKFKSVLMIVLGLALIVVQILAMIGQSRSNQRLDYGTGIFSVGMIMGTWLYLIVGALSLGFGIASIKKSQLIKGSDMVLTLSMGTAALAAAILSRFVVLYQSGQQTYTFSATNLHCLFTVLAMLTCGPLSMAVVALAFPYCSFTMNIYRFIDPDMQKYIFFYTLNLISPFVAPCVWAAVTNRFAQGGGWKRFLVGLAIGYCDLIAVKICFAVLKILITPAFYESPEWDVPILAVLCAVLCAATLCAATITTVTLWFFSRYDKKHPGPKTLTTADVFPDEEKHEVL